MKITKEYLRRVIKEELERVLDEELQQGQDAGDIMLGRALLALQDKIPGYSQSTMFNLSFDSGQGFAAKMKRGEDLMSGIQPNIAKGYAPYFQGVIQLVKENPILQDPSKGKQHAFASLEKAEQERKNQKA